MRRFEMTTGGHNKFWEVSIEEIGGVAHLVRRWGKIGTLGQDSKEARLSKYKAADEMNKLIEEKLAKGYFEIKHRTASPPRFPKADEAKVVEEHFPGASGALGTCARIDFGHTGLHRRHVSCAKWHISDTSANTGTLTPPSFKEPEPTKPQSIEDIRNKFRVKNAMAD